MFQERVEPSRDNLVSSSTVCGCGPPPNSRAANATTGFVRGTAARRRPPPIGSPRYLFRGSPGRGPRPGEPRNKENRGFLFCSDTFPKAGDRLRAPSGPAFFVDPPSSPPLCPQVLLGGTGSRNSAYGEFFANLHIAPFILGSRMHGPGYSGAIAGLRFMAPASPLQDDVDVVEQAGPRPSSNQEQDRADDGQRTLEDRVDHLVPFVLEYLAVVHAVCYETREIIEQLVGNGVVPTQIHLCGGLAKNPVFVQSLADVTGLRVLTADSYSLILLRYTDKRFLLALQRIILSSVLEDRSVSGRWGIFTQRTVAEQAPLSGV